MLAPRARFRSWFAALFLGCWLFPAAGCGVAGSSCSRDGDCAKGLSCVGPNDGPSCGIPPQQQCSSSADCPSGEVCHAIYDPCSQSAIGSSCGAKCGACSSGFRCNVAGACEPLPCDQGFVCAAYQRCDPRSSPASPVYQQTHGCIDVSCSTSSDCATGLSCVNGFCQSGPGSCKQVVAVP